MAPAPDLKPRRNRNPSARIADATNGEAPSAVHQHVLASEFRLDGSGLHSISRLSAMVE
jgi:hypothetical protein